MAIDTRDAEVIPAPKHYRHWSPGIRHFISLAIGGAVVLSFAEPVESYFHAGNSKAVAFGCLVLAGNLIGNAVVSTISRFARNLAREGH